MQIFNSGFFWFVEGILFVVMIMGMREWARGRGLSMTAWKWALFIAWVLLAGFTIAFVGTSFGEGESTAAIRGGLLFGLVSVIGGAGVWRVLLRAATSAEGDVVQQP
jgi:hypothetical protein